ncbi:MAG: translocation/assembly module TamB domain-containing protein [Acidobacteriota bacterium]
MGTLWKNTYFRRTVKTILWVFGILIALIIVLALALQMPQVQNYIAQQAIAPISAKTHTRIELGSVTISLPNSIVLKRIFIEGQARDTLLSVREIRADVNLFGLLSRTIRISNISIDSLTARVTRTLPDSAFNFDFLLDAMASDKKTPEPPRDTSASSWSFALYGLTLRGIDAAFIDEVGGMNARVRLGSLDLSMDAFDLEKRQFLIGSVTVKNTDASVIQSKSSPPDTSASKPSDIGLNSASLSNVRVRYENTAEGARYAADLGNAYLAANRIDIPGRQIALKQFSLGNSEIEVVLPPSAKDTTAAPDTTGIPWTFSLAKLNLGLSSIQYTVNGAKRQRGFDPNHLHLTGFALDAENLAFSASRASAYLKYLSFSDQSGLHLSDLSFYAVFDSLHAQLSDFVLETPTTAIRQDILLRYPSLAVLKNHPGDVRVNLSVDDSHIGIPDLLLFNPTLPLKKSERSIGISAALSGTVKDLHIDECTANAGSATVIDITGGIRGLPDAQKAAYDITLQKIATGRDDIRLFAVDTLLPKSVAVPSSVTLTGAFKGTMSDFTATADLVTSIGSMAASAAMSGGASSRTSRWNAKVTIDDFNLGALTNDTTGTLGPLSLTASADGSGLKKEDLAARLRVDVSKAVLLGYPYSGLSVEGAAAADSFAGTVDMKDSNLVFTYDGVMNFSREHPAYRFTFDLKGADLHRLRLSGDDLRVSASLVSDLTGSGVNDLNGHLDLRNVVIIKNGKRFAVDSLMYASVNKDRETHVSLESTIFGAKFDGTVALGDLSSALDHHFRQYFTLHDTASPPAAADSQSFTFSIQLRDPETITNVLLPSLTRLDAGVIEGSFNSLQNSLTVNIGMNRLTYGTTTVDSLLLTVASDERQLRTGLHVSSAVDSQFAVTNLDVNAVVEHDSIDVSMQSLDYNGGTKMLLSGILSSIRDGYQFRFKPDGIVFQNSRWSAAPDNYMQFRKQGFVAHNVLISDTGQSVSLQSQDEATPNSPLKINLSNFRLSTLSQIAERDSGFVGGALDGSVELRMGGKTMAFTSDLAIKDLSLLRKPVGDLTVRARSVSADTYEMAAGLTGNGNRVDLRGQYRTRDTVSALDMLINFDALNLASLEPFTFGAVTRMSGTMTGSLRVTGSSAKPSPSGTLTFADAAFNPTALDSYLKLNNGRVTLGAGGIELNSINLTDTLGNTASFGGFITTTDYSRFAFDLSIRTKDFLLMNKPPDPKALYYGTLFIDSDIHVGGNQDRPVVEMQAKLGKSSAVTFVLPEPGEGDLSEQGVVTFVDMKNPGNPIMTRKTPDRRTDDSLRKSASAIDFTANIEVTKDSKLRIFVDPTTGDSLVVQGDATFSVAMDPSGKLSLTGRYEISEGSYQVSFNALIKREFEISKGSSLTWFGTPFDANMDITAIYTVKTSTLDLVQDQISGMSQEERTKYRQELPIQVFLQMKGRLMKPDISFKIDLPEEQRGALGGAIYSKLTQVNEQEAELNKQVFALLVLGRFVSSDPLTSADEGSGLSGLARSSVSRVLTAQLNRLSKKYVKGVDLNVGVESGKDYSSGTAEDRTQLQVALSKSLFDERMTVQVGGNVDLEGPRSQQNSLNNFAGNVRVGYKLTEDGRWQMQVFRQQSYEGFIEGDIIETGVGLVFTIDYDKLIGISLTPEREFDTKEGSE